MAEEQDNVEVDDVADKATLIGKELGVEDKTKGKEDDVPEYEVVEEDDVSDERVAKEKNPAPKGERKQLSNKEKRDLRKKRVAEKFNAKDEVIAQQAAQMAAMAERLSQVEGRISNVDKAKLHDAITQTEQVYHQAERDHAQAFEENDGAKATKAMRLMYEAQRRLEQLNGLKQQEANKPVQYQPSADGPDPIVIKKGRAWAEKHDWYKPDEADEDSEIAKAISGTLVKEGFDPRTDDYWEELDERLASRGIGADETEEDEDDKPKQRKDEQPRRRSAPPVGGSSHRGGGDGGGKVQIKLSTKFVQALKDNGKWDDLPTRNRLIKEHLAIRRENQAS